MFVRLVYAQTDKRDELREWYETVDIPTVKDQKGLRALMFLESVDNPQEVASLTIWENQEAADEYENNGPYKELVNKVTPMFTQEPTLKSYKVTVVHHN
jgi:heme-degrading monooxygenase HmoA